jgi:hypothetical protein
MMSENDVLDVDMDDFAPVGRADTGRADRVVDVDDIDDLDDVDSIDVRAIDNSRWFREISFNNREVAMAGRGAKRPKDVFNPEAKKRRERIEQIQEDRKLAILTGDKGWFD